MSLVTKQLTISHKVLTWRHRKDHLDNMATFSNKTLFFLFQKINKTYACSLLLLYALVLFGLWCTSNTIKFEKKKKKRSYWYWESTQYRHNIIIINKYSYHSNITCCFDIDNKKYDRSFETNSYYKMLRHDWRHCLFQNIECIVDRKDIPRSLSNSMLSYNVRRSSFTHTICWCKASIESIKKPTIRCY